MSYEDLVVDIGSINCLGNISTPTLTASTSATLANPSFSGTTRHSTDLVASVSANKTLAVADSGIAQRVTTDAITVTLPTASTNLLSSYKIENNGATDGAVLVTVALQTGTDTIKGAGITPGAGKAFLNTKATAKIGDYVIFQSDGVANYLISAVRGTWVRAP